MTDRPQQDSDARIKEAFESGDMLLSIALKQQRHRKQQARAAKERNKNQ